MKEKNEITPPQTQQRQSKKKAERPVDMLFRFTGYLENLLEWFPGLPEDLQKDLNRLIDSSWQKVIDARNTKRASLTAAK